MIKTEETNILGIPNETVKNPEMYSNVRWAFEGIFKTSPKEHAYSC